MRVLATIAIAGLAAGAFVVSACGGTAAKTQDQGEVRPDTPKPPEPKPPEPKPTPDPPDTGDPPPESAPPPKK
jgi:hypothetical protein